jgi:hypothetical protein
MSPSVCRCCGELIREKPDGFSGSLNLCAACQDLPSGFLEPTVIEPADSLPGPLAVHEDSAEMQNPA